MMIRKGDEEVVVVEGSGDGVSHHDVYSGETIERTL